MNLSGSKISLSRLNEGLLCCIVFFNVLYAEEVPFPERWTMDRFIDKALISNPSIKVERQRLLQKQSQEIESKLIRRPSLSLSVSSSESHADSGHSRNHSSSFSLSQPIYQGGRIDLQAEQGALNTSIAELMLLRSEQNLKLRVKMLWYDLLMFKAVYIEEESAMKRMKKHKRNVDEFFNQSKVWKNDLLQAEVKVARVKKSLLAAENDVLTAKAEINQIIGRDIDYDFDIEGQLKFSEHLWNWKKIREIDIEIHPDLLLNKLKVAQSEIAYQITKTATKPSLSLSGSYSQDYRPKSSDHHSQSSSIALTGSWSFWQGGRNRQKEISARRGKRAARLQVQVTRQAIVLNSKKQWLALEEAEEQIKVLKKALKHAQENYRVNEVRYQEQMGTGNDILDAEDLLKNTRMDWLRAIRDYHKAIAQLEFALGLN